MGLNLVFHLALTDSLRDWLSQATQDDPFYVNVQVLGPVRYPGTYQLPNEVDFLEVIRMSGGLKREFVLKHRDIALRIKDKKIVDVEGYVKREKRKFKSRNYEKRYRKSRY